MHQKIEYLEASLVKIFKVIFETILNYRKIKKEII